MAQGGQAGGDLGRGSCWEAGRLQVRLQGGEKGRCEVGG